MRAVRHVPDLDAGETVEPIVGRAIDLDDQHSALDQLDERDEQLAVQPVLVEVAGRPVRGGDDLHAFLDQLAEQPRQDHRVGRVRDLHLVEAQQLGLGGDLFRDRLDRIAFLALASFAQTPMRLEHELVKMDPALRVNVDMLEREVHQHRLAAADATPEVNARRPLLPGAEEARKKPFAILDSVREPVERGDCALLRGIGLQLVRGNQSVVGDPYGSAHRDEGPLGRFTFFSVPLKL